MVELRASSRRTRWSNVASSTRNARWMGDRGAQRRGELEQLAARESTTAKGPASSGAARWKRSVKKRADSGLSLARRWRGRCEHSRALGLLTDASAHAAEQHRRPLGPAVPQRPGQDGRDPRPFRRTLIASRRVVRRLPHGAWPRASGAPRGHDGRSRSRSHHTTHARPAGARLDVACGDARIADPLERAGKTSRRQHGPAGPRFVQGDLRALPREMGTFDVVISWATASATRPPGRPSGPAPNQGAAEPGGR